MPEYLSPGVYVEEIQTGPRPIEGVGTSTAGMVGQTERGPVAPRLITSWLQFQRWYGGYLPTDVSFTPYAVKGFFDNGGQRMFFTRAVADDAVPATFNDPNMNLRYSAVGRGAWGNGIIVRIREGGKFIAGDPKAGDLFRLDVLYYTPEHAPANLGAFVDPLDAANAGDPNRIEPDAVETYDNLTHRPGVSNNVERVINAGSNLLRAYFTGAAQPFQPVPYTLLTNGADGAFQADTDYAGDNDPIVVDAALTPERSALLFGRGRGLEALATIDEIALLAVPDEIIDTLFAPVGGVSPITTLMIDQCEQLKDRFAVVSAYPGQPDPNSPQPLMPPRDTSYAAFYYPWIEIYDPVTNGPILIPPTGHVLGLIARTDVERGVFKAPANEVVRGATNLEFPVPKGTQDMLNPRGVNCIRDFRPDGRGIRLWGARTMSSDPLWKYINVRRLFLFIEESIDEGTQWVVFEPNDEPLWAQVRRSVSGFLYGVWKSGALMGLTQEEAFFVKCDRTTMTPDDIDNGRLVCYIGVAPVKPAEFVIFRIMQKTAEAPA